MMKKQTMIIAAVVCAAAVQAENVYLDLSSAFNYDAFTTDNEMQANAVLKTDLGDHDLTYAQQHGMCHYAGSRGIGGDGLVDRGNFEVAKGIVRKFDSEDGKKRVNNAVSFIEKDDVTKKAVTITLVPAEQQNYTSLNVLVNANRYTKRPNLTLSAEIEVKYAGDETWYSLWSEKVAIDNGEPGGCFGGSVVKDAYSTESAAWTAVPTASVVPKTSQGETILSSGQKPQMFKLAKPLPLDVTKKLESFRLTATTPEKFRVNEYILFAATATTP